MIDPRSSFDQVIGLPWLVGFQYVLTCSFQNDEACVWGHSLGWVNATAQRDEIGHVYGMLSPVVAALPR